MNAINSKRSRRSRALSAAAVLIACAAALLALSAPAASAAGTPEWSIEVVSPTYFVPGRSVTYKIVATNVGSAPAEAGTLTDQLPNAIEFESVAFRESGFPFVFGEKTGENVELNFLCSPPTGPIAQEVSCSYPLPVEPGQRLMMVINGKKLPSDAAQGPVLDEAQVEGGGASASTSAQSTISSHPVFDIAQFSMQTTQVQQAPSAAQPAQPLVNKPVAVTQAGAHPAALTTTLQFTSQDVNDFTELGKVIEPVGDAKDAVVDLPPGLLGDPMAVPRCSLPKVITDGERCPADTQVGIAKLVFFGQHESIAPIVNLTPEAGQSAVFGLETSFKVAFILTAHVVRVHAPRPGEPGREEYSVTVASKGIPISELTGTELTFWGVPADPSHDPLRGLVCRRVGAYLEAGDRECEGGNKPDNAPAVPFLTLPEDCTAGPEAATVRADSWEQPGSVGTNGGYSEQWKEATATLPDATGCNALAFDPSLEVQPDTSLADAPVGLGVNLTVPQSEEPRALGTPEMSRSVISLPSGLSVSPGVVDGIQACNETGPEGINFTGSESEEVNKLTGELQLAPGHCPDASTVGEAEAETPLLPEPIKGHVYLARPGCGAPGQRPCTERDALDGDLYQLYLELGGAGKLANTGVNIKVRLKTEADPATGQLTSVAEEIAQLPFSQLRIRLNGGPRAPLANPPACGLARTTADFSTWAAPGRIESGPNAGVFTPGLPDASPISAFEVTGCANPPGLSPGFVAGTVIPNAGRFSPFTMNLTRNDRDQYVKGVQVKTPPGLLGMLSSVPLCGEPAADEGACAESSKIGTTRVASGAGSHPFEIEGDVYLTTGYGGAPFGLSIVTHAVAGPFNLGVVVVRARIHVDPTTSALTITTDETGPHAIPQVLDGVPLRLKRITVNVDRPGFMFNPTDCKAKQITATVSGTGQALAHVSSPFAAGDCRHLAFKPTFKASTNGHTSRKRGASLDVRLSFPKEALGNDANVAKARVELPKALPSYLPTLQKACLAEVFESDPAKCPAGSIVGIAKTRTPVLPVELKGPVYFVSHGGAKFPSLIVVLQGDGVRVDLEGETFIKNGVTSSTFNAVPDVPVNSFELYLPQGKSHALAANVNLCTHRRQLVMPTMFWAQNGKVMRQNTKIAVTGCGKAKAKNHHRKHKRRGSKVGNVNGRR